MITPRRIILALLVTIAPTGGLAHAGDTSFADIGRIEADVTKLLGQPAGTPGGLVRPIDRAMRLPACAAPPTIIVLPTRVRLRCVAPGWSFALDRTVPAATPRPPVGDKAPVIRKGDPVTAMVSGGGFVAAIHGRAAEDATVGELILIETPDARRLRVRVDGPGSASAAD